MHTFFYRATTAEGTTQTGHVRAENASAAIAQVESQNLSVQSIEIVFRSTGEQQRTARSGAAGSLTAQEGVHDHFEAALQRRDVLIPALTAMAAEMPRGRARRELIQLLDLLRSCKHPGELRVSPIALTWLPMLVGGGASASSSRRISDLAARMSEESQARYRRRRMLAYPLVVVSLAFVVLVFVSLIVVPTFDTMFDEFGLVLPAPTRAILLLSRELHFHFPRLVLSLAIAAAAACAIVFIWSRYALSTRLFGVFSSGSVSAVTAMASFTAQISDLLAMDICLPDALWMAGQSCQHHHFKRVAEQLARDTHSGMRISVSPVAHYLPGNVIDALEGQSGDAANIQLLRQLSLMYGDRASQRLDLTVGVFPQFSLIVVVGLIVGFITIALFLPLVELISGLS